MHFSKAYPSDFNKIYPLLSEFGARYSSADWQKLFNYSWPHKENYIGYYLEDLGIVVGFVSFIFSERDIDQKTIKFCNISSLIVKKEYRNQLILFIKEIHKLTSYTLTGLSPRQETYDILKRIGFADLDTKVRIYFSSVFFYNIINPFMKLKTRDFESLLNNSEKVIIKDLDKTAVSFLHFTYKKTSCLMAYRITYQEKFLIKFTKIHFHYISNPQFFKRHLPKILQKLCSYFGPFTLLYIESRFASKKFLIGNYDRPNWVPLIFKSLTVKAQSIDILYSEHSLL